MLLKNAFSRLRAGIMIRNYRWFHLAAIFSLLLLSNIMNFCDGSSNFDELVGDVNPVQCGDEMCGNMGQCINDTFCYCWPGFLPPDCSTETYCPSVYSLLSNVGIIHSYGNSYGSYVTYNCKYGYQFSDVTDSNNACQRTIRCNEDGTWGPNLADCKALCPVIPTWFGYDTNTVLRIDGTALVYGCQKYYTSSSASAYAKAESTLRYTFADGSTNKKLAFCQNGNWLPPIVDCVDLQYNPMPTMSSNVPHQFNSCVQLVMTCLLLCRTFEEITS